MTELTLTPEQKLEQSIQESDITLKLTIRDAETLMNLLAELPYKQSRNAIDAIMSQAMPQAKVIREALTKSAGLANEKATETPETTKD